MSANDRRAGYMTSQRPRVASNRVADAEKASPRSAATSFQSANSDQMRVSPSGHKAKASREQNATSEKRSEQPTVATREKAHARTRSSVKESTGSGNREEREKVRPKRASHADVGPNVRKEKEQTEGQSYLANPGDGVVYVLTAVPCVFYSPLESASLFDTSLDGALSLSGFCTSSGLSIAATAATEVTS